MSVIMFDSVEIGKLRDQVSAFYLGSQAERSSRSWWTYEERAYFEHKLRKGLIPDGQEQADQRIGAEIDAWISRVWIANAVAYAATYGENHKDARTAVQECMADDLPTRDRFCAASPLRLWAALRNLSCNCVSNGGSCWIGKADQERLDRTVRDAAEAVCCALCDNERASGVTGKL